MKFCRITCVMISVLTFYSCGPGDNKESSVEQISVSEWPEMDSFHMVMSEAFHPYKDSANFDPVKRLAEVLAQQAEAWASAELPDKVNNDEMKAQLNQLKEDTHALSALIKESATDEELSLALNDLHDSFHKIMEAWKDGNHEHPH